MKSTNPIVQRTITQILSGVAILSVAAPAMAQNTLEEVTVTGTRIAKPDAVSTSPITTVTAETLEQLNTVNLESQLRQLPQFLPGSTEFINNGNPGAATINLRGLGSNRTLVLMDGKRLPPFGTSGAVDINLIPAPIIERIDIVTGGASAVYGSDAVSGVVNFITKKDFEGVEVGANISQYGEGDGQVVSASMTAGSAFADDRGSAIISFGYTKRDEVLQGDRPYSNFNLFAADGYRYAGNWYQYSSDIFGADRRLGSSNAGTSRAAIRNAAGGFSTRHFTPDGNLVPTAGLGQYAPNASFNYNPYNYFQVPQERWQAFASAEYDISDSVRAYGRVFAVNSSVPTQLASSAFFGGSTSTFKVNLDNPFLTAAQRTALITAYNNEAAFPIAGQPAHGVFDPAAAPGTQLVTVNGLRRRLIELGPRVGISESKTLQLTAGVEGDIGDSGWTWDVSAQWGRVSRFDGTENDVSIARARNAIIAIQTPDGIKCVSGGECAPVNIFSGNGAPYRDTGIPMTGAISQAGLDYIRASYYSSQTTEAHAASASVAGELGAFKLPTADAGLGLAFGLDWNENISVYRPDDLTQFGGAMGQGGTSPPLKGRVDSTELFAEAYLPLVTGKTGIQNLALDLGVRFSDTNLAGSFETWKAGLEYTPVEGYRFRTMLQKAVRAPNIGEQFAPLSFGLTEVRTDPCAGSAPVTNAALRAKCIAQGAPAAQIGSIGPPAAQQAGSIGGGAVALGIQLVPEEADTFTIGLQASPAFLPGFSASVDYYKIEIAGGIGSYGAQEVLDNCFNRDISEFCSLVRRNSLGELEGDGFGIVQAVRNLSTINAEGIDYAFSYDFDVGDFDFGLGIAGTHTLDSSFKSSPASPVIECQGVYGDTCGNPTAEDRINLSATVGWKSLSATVFVRHLSAVDVQERADDPDQTGRSIYLIEKIPAVQYVDLSLQWRWNDALKVTLAAQNLLDEEPTIVGNIPGGNTAPNAYVDIYDPLGPKYSLGVTYKF
jgi:outer membrane receptor protein involved in Fe transport